MVMSRCRLRQVRRPFGAGAAFKGDVVRLLQSFPEEGGITVRLSPRTGATREGSIRSTDSRRCEKSSPLLADGRKPLPRPATDRHRTGDLSREIHDDVFRKSNERAALVVTALLIVTPLSTAQGKKQTTVQTSKQPVADQKAHRVVLQVDTNDPAMMNLALNNATNVAQYYKDLGEKVSIEVVTFGPGLHMLRDDTSPVKARIEVIALSMPEISFKACGNTQENMHKAEQGHSLVPQAQVVKSGVVRILELQEQGWSYVKP